MAKGITPRKLRLWINCWLPFLFGGVRLLAISDDWRYARVQLKLRWYNRNYVGTQFGGLLFAMTDPFWMIMVMECLGRDYLVWDKAGKIEFISPGRSDVYAEFRVQESVLDELRSACAGGEKVLRWFAVDVCAADGTIVARVEKQLYVRLKRSARAIP